MRKKWLTTSFFGRLIIKKGILSTKYTYYAITKYVHINGKVCAHLRPSFCTYRHVSPNSLKKTKVPSLALEDSLVSQRGRFHEVLKATSQNQTNWPSSENVTRLVLAIGKEEMSVKSMMEAVGLKNRPNFMDYSLTPAIREGFVCMKYPANPHHPRQRYLLTIKGLMLLDGNNS